jgi:hypothetical protein
MEQQGIQFQWTEYRDLHGTLLEMFQKAKAVPETGRILGLLGNTGDLLEYSLRDIEMKLIKYMNE